MNNKNLFNAGFTQQTQNLYDEITKLRGNSLQMPSYRTVFNDIADEWNKSSKEEQLFINNDADYVNASIEYQQAFNSFLLEMVGQQFMASQYGKTAEQVLVVLRKAKDKYRKNADDAVKNVQEQNVALQAEIAELRKMLGGKADGR